MLLINLVFSVKYWNLSHPPILQSPVPPLQALMYLESAHRDTGLAPVLKYEPTGLRMTKSNALLGFLTPRVGCSHRHMQRKHNISQNWFFFYIYSYHGFTSMMFSWSYSVFFTLNGKTESKTHIYQHLLIAKFEKLKIVQMRLLWEWVFV